MLICLIIFQYSPKPEPRKKAPKHISCRPLTISDKVVDNIIKHLHSPDWSTLHELQIDAANDTLINAINNALDIYSHQKIVKIPYKNVLRQP